MADDVHSNAYQSIFPNKIIPDQIRGTVTFQHNETTVFSVEELLAMQLSHAKELAENTAQEAIKDVVITVFMNPFGHTSRRNLRSAKPTLFFPSEKVPPYYNQFERQAVLDAAELAGLKVLSLINEETAGLFISTSDFFFFTRLNII